MTQKEKDILEEIYKKIEYNNKDFNLSNLNHLEASKKVYSFLETIVDYAGCHDYIFVYAITKLEEKHGKYMLPYLFEILDNYCNYKDYFNEDVAFSAFYNIGLHYARYFQVNELYTFITKTPYISIFKDKYPLAYGCVGRYCDINGMHDRMLLLDQATIKHMKKLKSTNPEYFKKTKYGYEQTGDNVAIKVGIVAATVAIFEQKFIRGILYSNDEMFNRINLDDISRENLLEEIKNNNNYEIDDSLINNDTLNMALEYVDAAIEYNPLYPKYPFLKAQIIFYQAIFNNIEISFELISKIKELLNLASSLENVNANDYSLRVSKYTTFLSRVELFMEKGSTNNKINLEYLNKKKEFIKMTSCPPPQNRIKPTVIGNEPYAFISYSTLDFKSVYCDLLSLTERNINFWYDASVIAGEQWHLIIEEKIKNSTCIICYLSPGFLKSQAIYKELTLFKKYNKPIIWIDLTGKKQISKIILDVMRTSNIDVAMQISSNMLNIITELIDDDVDIISRDFDPLAEVHINRIENVIIKKYNQIVNSITASYLSVRNTKLDKNNNVGLPNEDYVICDNINNIYIVMDGITRKKEEYIDKDKSIAYDVSYVFATNMHKYIKENISKCKDFSSSRLMMIEGFKKANRFVSEMLIEKKGEYLDNEIPGAVGIVGFIHNHILYYGSFGDCMGILVRGDQKIIFGKKQTTFAFEVLNKEKSREILQERFVNKPNEDFGYGVVNGDDLAYKYFNISYINLDKGDTIYLLSDGISDYIEYNKVDKFINLDVEEIVNDSFLLDKIMNKPYNDDKSIIKIVIDSNKDY